MANFSGIAVLIETTKPSEASDWSLPLTSFEEFLRGDDLPKYPMEFWLRIHLAGGLDIDRWSRAFWQQIHLQPLLTARVRWRNEGSWEFIPGESSDEMLQFDRAPERREITPIDLQHQPGLRCWVDQSSGPAVLMLQCHHLVSDALGILGWLARVMQQYHAEVPSPETPLSLRELQQRDGPPRSLLQRCLSGPYDILGFCGLLEYLCHRPAMFGGGEIATQQVSNLSPDVQIQFTRQETDQLRAVASRRRFTLNDLFTTALFRALSRIQQRRSRDECHRPIRIMIPASLRDWSSSRFLVANQVGMLFLDRRPAWFNDRWLLWSVKFELSLCKRWQAARTFLRILDWSRRWWGSLHWLQPTDRSTATAVLSNLGDPWSKLGWPVEASETRPQRLEFWPPLRPGTTVSCGIATTADVLCISLHGDQQRLKHEDIRELRDNYESELRRYLQD